jgi:D-threo-aldose 1-dehydrogenase
MSLRLELPKLGFGTAPLATAPAWGAGEPIPEAQAVEALQTAYEKGIRFFDTAPNYGKGLAEKRTGILLGQLPRETFTVATKVGFDISGERVKRDYSRDGVLRSLEGSLKRLQLDTVDILHVHDPDNHFEEVMDNAFPALADLRSQGVIKAIGAGMNQWQMLARFAEAGDFDCLMIASRYTLLEQGAVPLLNLALAKGIQIIAASIYNSGILATGSQTTQPRYNHGEAPKEIIERVQKLEAICQQFAIPLHSAASQFPLAHPAIQSIVVGFQSSAEVQACLNALAQAIPADFWKKLQSEALILPASTSPKV